MENNWRQSYFRYREYFLNIYAFYRQKESIKSYLEIILTLTTIIIFSLFAVRPTIVTIIELNKEIKAKQTTLNTLKDKIESLKEAQSTLSAVQPQMELLNIAIPGDPDPDTLLGQLQTISAQSQIDPEAITFDQIIIKGQRVTDYTTFTITANGNYQLFAGYLSALENALRPVIFNRLIITKDTLVVNAKSPYEK